MVLAIAATLVIGIQAYQVISVNDLLRRQQITSEFVDLVNRRVAGQRGWTWKNQEAILSLAGSGTKIVDPADWRSELLAAHMAVDVEFRETLAPEISFFDLKFHPQRPDELVAIDLKGLAGFPRYIRRLKISDDQTTEEAFSYSPDYLFELQSLGKQDGGRSLAFSQTGDLVACGTRAGDVIVRRYDQLDKDLIRIKTGRGAPLSVAFSPDARYLFALKEARLQRYDVENGFVMDLEQVVDQARQFKLLPNGDGLRLELGTEYDWELNPTATSAYANGYSNSTPAPHGLYVAATDQVRRVMVHDGNSTQPLRNLGEAALVVNLDFSPDGRFLCAAGDEQFRMWDLYDGRLVLDRMLLRGGRLKGAFSPDGRNLLITNRQGIDRYALQGAGVFRVHGIGAQPVHSFQQIGDGLLVVYHSFEVQQITVAYWDLSSGQLKNSIVLRPDELADVLPILVDPDRGQAVIGWRTKRESGVCVLDLHEPQWQTAPRQIFLIPDVLRWAALRDQRVLVSRDRDLWSWRGWQGQPDRTILDVSLQDRLRGSAKITVTQQLDGRWFAGSETGDWYCCEIEDGKSIAQGRVAAGVSISALAASPDGDGLAVGTNHGEVTLTSLRQPQPARVWQVGEDEVSALAWIDAQTLVSATRSGSIVVWNLDVAQPERYATLLPGGRPVVRMSYCPVQDALLFQQEGSYGVGQIAWPQLRQIIAAAGLD
jgi:WD40 repeat protein